jgi:hypothetical protein
LFNKIKKRFATLSLNKGFVTTSQVLEALTIQIQENVVQKKHRPIGEILMDLGYMNKEQIQEVMDSSVEPRFGDTAISMGLISIDQLVEAMSRQLKEDANGEQHRLIGEILVDLGYMDHQQVQLTLDAMQANV